MITFIYGPNVYASRSALQAIKADHAAQNITAEIIDGDTLAPADIPGILQSVSLFADKRLVVIKDASRNKAAWDALGDNLDAIGDELSLVLVETAPDKRTKTYKRLQQVAMLVAADEMNELQLVEWIGKRLPGLQRALAQHLVERVGADQQRLFTEAAKLSQYDTSELSRELIDAIVPASPQANAFALLDAIFAGNTVRVKDYIVGLRAAGEEPYMLFGLLAKQVYVLVTIAAARREKFDDAAVIKVTKAAPFTIRKLNGPASKLGADALRAMAAEMAKLDMRLKTSATDPWDLVENTCLRLAGGGINRS